jgi:hypothetical protein
LWMGSGSGLNQLLLLLPTIIFSARIMSAMNRLVPRRIHLTCVQHATR